MTASDVSMTSRFRPLSNASNGEMPVRIACSTANTGDWK